MKIVAIGAGAAGLYFAISMKLRDPNHEITVVERNKPDDTFGWGVVFSDQTLDNLRANDLKSAEEIIGSFAHWDDIDIHFKGQVMTSSGHGFIGISRKRLLNILQERARELGVKIQFEREVDSVEPYKEADLILVSDGANSRIRDQLKEHFRPDIDVRPNKYVWLGTHRVFDAFTFIFEKTEHGWIWVHAYRFDEETSTFIVECQESTWGGLGFDKLSQEESIALCEKLFAKYLAGHSLMTNAKHLRGSAWLNFPRIGCAKWHYKNIVLIGDAAHTAHFSIGSGTKLALEDAIDLSRLLHEHHDMECALEKYQEARRVEVLKLQSTARNSMEWFENVPRYVHFEPMQFAYALLTRSQRVSHENLRLRDREWLEGVERWFAARSNGKPIKKAVPPMFTPFKLRELTLMNRVVVSPMCMYSAEDGTPNDFHLVHYGTRAQGGAGLIFTEMTDISREARISPGCAGLYKEEHVIAWKRIVEFVHKQSRAKFALQIAHAGPKGSTKLSWEGDCEPLPSENWGIIGPSPIPWTPQNQIPREMTHADMNQVISDFVRATQMAIECGFDMLELHSGHGYLLSSFITPLSNQRKDEYGGSLENRLRFPLEVFRAIRKIWPQERPMSVRISACDWVGTEGITSSDAVEIAKSFKAAGADIIDVSAGQTTTRARPIYGRMFQTPFSDQIRNEAGIATLAVGNIYEVDHVNSIIAAGRADLCCLARPHLWDPYWTLRAAAQQGYADIPWPNQYLSGRDQLERLVKRSQETGMAINI
ncbi:bifunctional salicylyl-CoA 5-hydroxylase/oxidoreductase [Candidatus Acetothermia bacterium]|nr:bifunctional salicylyl-CoA 5-hydroxylase/oxidoreductase [Candidatus Acetothermia bacterium]MBI3642606.1 bifunctional salicylyl-CoA 5-hydroxylase/oxidoreductase [Candidatus Acetothermia bacterium]